MRVLVDHADEEVSGIFLRGLDGRLPFRKRWDDEGFVPPALVPRARVGYFSIALLPELSLVATADQGKRSAGHNRNVGTADDFEQAERMRDFFIAPLVSADHCGSQHLNLWRLNHYQKRLQIAAAGTR